MDLVIMTGSACCCTAGIILAVWPLAYLIYGTRVTTTITWEER